MKFAQYLSDTQTPEWKRAYIDYRLLKKRITAIRRYQQGQELQRTFETPDGARSAAPPATPRPSFTSELRTSVELNAKDSDGQDGDNHVPESSARTSITRAEGLPQAQAARRGSIFGRTSRNSRTSGPPSVQQMPLSMTELELRLIPVELEFFKLLDHELDKVESFYLDRENEMLARGRNLDEQLRELKEHKRLFMAQHAKVPWAAAFTSALRPKQRQLKVTRTISISEDPRTRRPSPTIMERFLPFLMTRQASQTSTLTQDDNDRLYPASRVHSRKGGTSDAGGEKMFGLSSPARSTNGDIPSRPMSPGFAPDGDNYLYAKRKLKKAVIEHYKGLELLHNYRVLNLTGFRKALKKFEKVTKIPAQEQYMSERVDKSAFASDKSLQQMIKATEDMYASAFFSGNKKKAMKRLRGGARVKSHHFSTWRSGLMMGLAVPALASGLVHAFEEETMQQIPGWEALLRVYAILLIPTLFAALVGLNLLVWARSRINYIFIFELNVATCLDYREYFEIPTILLALLSYAFWLSFAQVGAPQVSPEIWPLVWLGAVVLLVINPTPVLFRPSRFWLTRMSGRLFLSGTRRVEFTDFWLGDQFCSLVFTLSNLYFFGCAYATGFSPEWRECRLGETKFWPLIYVLAILPFFIRFVQSVKRFYDSKLVTHLINGGKYGSGMVTYLFYVLWRHTGTHRHGVIFAFYCLTAAVYSIYSLTWDLLMDWSFLQRHSPNLLLRPNLLYADHKFLYYTAIISNIILRLTWVIYLPSSGPTMFIRTFIVACCEMLRRIQWNFYRLENEHLGNMDQYRVTREVPLPYLFDDPHRESDRDDDDEEEVKRR